MSSRSLVAYHNRRRVEAELELERLRRAAPIVQHVPVHVPGPPEPCHRRHVGPGTAVLAGLGALVVLGFLFGRSDS